MTLEQRYREYLAVLNERRPDDLGDYVADEVTYNGEPMTREQYWGLIADGVAADPELFYDAEIVVATADWIACRIMFRCAPRGPFVGFVADGRRLEFAEHVFYRFDAGRIVEVSSLIDRAAIAEQLRQRS